MNLRMNKLTYSLVYTPSLDDGLGADDRDINWLCSDRKIHIRLRDYTKPEVITGFVNKLTYLVTYLVNSGCTSSLESVRENPDSYLDTFCKNDEDFLRVVDLVKSSLHEPRYQGIKVSKVYRKKKVNKPNSFGIISDGVLQVEDSYKLGNLSYFVESMRIPLHEFLFNDAYTVVLSNDPARSCYDKFVRKSFNKSSAKGDLEYIPLV